MPAPTTTIHEENHWKPTRGQKVLAAVEEFWGKVLNNQARILESRTTRTGVPCGPGGNSVTPPASYFKIQPPNIGRSALGMGSEGQGVGYQIKQVQSSASDRTAVNHSGGKGSQAAGHGAGPGTGESKHVHGLKTGVGGGHHGGYQGQADEKRKRTFISGK